MAEENSSLGQILQLGIKAQRAGQYDEAEQAYRSILNAAPEHFEARYLLGLVFLQRNRFDAAEKMIGEAIAVNTNNASAYANHGMALFQLGRCEDAIQSCDRAILLNPGFAPAHLYRAKSLLVLRRAADALAGFDRALAINLQLAEAWSGRANALLALGRTADALASFDRLLALEPQNVAALCSRGYTLESLKRYDEALLSYERAYALKPDTAFLEGARLHAKMHICDWRDFGEDVARLLRHVDEGKPVASPFALIPIASSGRQQRLAAENFAAPPALQPLWNGERYAHDKIRIAYLSASLLRHPVGILAAGLFEHHDRSRFETFALSFTPGDGTDIRQRLESAFDHFIHAEQTGDRDIAQWMRQREIDIAVDLDGFTSGARTEILALRPAPIQVSFLGYPSTLGAAYMDYIIADPFVIPPDAEPDFAEKIARLPESYLPNSARNPLGPPPPRHACGLPGQGIVFCCFNNMFKFTPDAFDIWMRLLRAIDGSVLWLREGDPVARANLGHEAQKRGVSADRLIFAKHTPTQDDHFARHQLADIFLDTLYYNAHTTASDALWAGVPVVTCLGPAFAGRVGASLMHAAGLGDLVTNSPAEYEALALRLARDPDFLASVKDRLKQNRASAPLFDTKRFTRHLERAYLTMWEGRGQAPASFTVAPDGNSSLP